MALPAQPFDSRLPASHPDNKAAVEFVSSTELPEPLKELYGKYQTCRIMMRRSEWLMAIGAHPNLWKVCLRAQAALLLLLPPPPPRSSTTTITITSISNSIVLVSVAFRPCVGQRPRVAS